RRRVPVPLLQWRRTSITPANQVLWTRTGLAWLTFASAVGGEHREPPIGCKRELCGICFLMIAPSAGHDDASRGPSAASRPALDRGIARRLRGGPSSGSLRAWPTTCNIWSVWYANSQNLRQRNEPVLWPRRLGAGVLRRGRAGFQPRS